MWARLNPHRATGTSSLLFSTRHSTGDRTPLRPTASRPRACCPSPSSPPAEIPFRRRPPCCPRAPPPGTPLPRAPPPAALQLFRPGFRRRLRAPRPRFVAAGPAPEEEESGGFLDTSAQDSTPPLVGCRHRLHPPLHHLYPCCSVHRLAAHRCFSGHRCPRRVVNSVSTNLILHRGHRLWGVGAASALLLPPPSARDPHLSVRAAASRFSIFHQAHALNFIHGTATRQ